MMADGIVHLFVYAQHNCQVFLLGRGRDDHLLCAGL